MDEPHGLEANFTARFGPLAAVYRAPGGPARGCTRTAKSRKSSTTPTKSDTSPTVIEVNKHEAGMVITTTGTHLARFLDYGEVSLRVSRKGVQGMLLGSETHKVLTHSRIPVLVYR